MIRESSYKRKSIDKSSVTFCKWIYLETYHKYVKEGEDEESKEGTSV